ncbi:hypothetical protein F3Y22_tig00110818pilonHSYRG00011 [Hibiscus syriacus]|uniref:Uncharacterized protein n=1 Tax=Hibiscus syriacus TaxID=106335 RepID=A0A6A2ZMQ4_HIBSY|nr:hypothetical protein F3Y22_tig00110818pilonHSYRG00011 [Hibiscus syriacus]
MWNPKAQPQHADHGNSVQLKPLGGHMNVHRRDRARLHQMQPAKDALTINQTSSIHLPSLSVHSPSTSISMSPYPSVNLMAAATTAAPSIQFPVTLPGLSNSSFLRYSTKTEPSTLSADHNLNDGNSTGGIKFRETSIEELDLELRLGHRPTTS